MLHASIGRDGGCRWIRGEPGAERRQLIAGAYRVPAEVKIKWHEARPFGGTTAAESLSGRGRMGEGGIV